jgi:hypothetical protein
MHVLAQWVQCVGRMGLQVDRFRVNRQIAEIDGWRGEVLNSRPILRRRKITGTAARP